MEQEIGMIKIIEAFAICAENIDILFEETDEKVSSRHIGKKISAGDRITGQYNS